MCTPATAAAMLLHTLLWQSALSCSIAFCLPSSLHSCSLLSSWPCRQLIRASTTWFPNTAHPLASQATKKRTIPFVLPQLPQISLCCTVYSPPQLLLLQPLFLLSAATAAETAASTNELQDMLICYSHVVQPKLWSPLLLPPSVIFLLRLPEPLLSPGRGCNCCARCIPASVSCCCFLLP